MKSVVGASTTLVVETCTSSFRTLLGLRKVAGVSERRKKSLVNFCPPFDLVISQSADASAGKDP